jgi:hypothetical protein
MVGNRWCSSWYCIPPHSLHAGAQDLSRCEQRRSAAWASSPFAEGVLADGVSGGAVLCFDEFWGLVKEELLALVCHLHHERGTSFSQAAL